MNHESRWEVNENLLQSYRSIFISSQSFFLAVGVLLAQWSFFLFLAAFLSAQYVIWKVWKEVVFSRSLIVDYHKYQIDVDVDPGCSESQYVENPGLRYNANEILGIMENIRETRKKIDVYIPKIYSALWVFLLLGAIFK